MNTPWPIVALIGLFGLAIGSFLNVVIYRVPRDESIVFPASHCPGCNFVLRPWHNVPILSWLGLRGRCANCRNHISFRYPLVEAGTAALFVAITLRFGLTLALPAYLYLAAVGVTLAMIDLDVHRLPEKIMLPSYVLAILLLMPAGAASGEWISAGRAAVGMASLGAIYATLAIVYHNGMHGGDAKLAGLLGLYLGWLSWGALLIGGIGGLALGCLGAVALAPTHRGSRAIAITLGPYMIAAAGVALFLAVPITEWYGSLLSAT